MQEETKGCIISTVVPGIFLLGTRLGEWYRKNSYHKFDKGDILILKARNIEGFGVRPVAFVNDYRIEDFLFGPEGKYDITMNMDKEFLPIYLEYEFPKRERFPIDDRWTKYNEVPQGVERTVNEHEFHFKWNIENLFKKVQVKTVEEALDLYASREIMLKGVAA